MIKWGLQKRDFTTYESQNLEFVLQTLQKNQHSYINHACNRISATKTCMKVYTS